MSYVYFIQAGDGGPIKIGMTNNPMRRRDALQTASHALLTIVAVTDGGAAEEKALHSRFSTSRIIGEWFSPDTSLLAFLSKLTPFDTPTRTLRKRKYKARKAKQKQLEIIPKVFDESQVLAAVLAHLAARGDYPRNQGNAA